MRRNIVRVGLLVGVVAGMACVAAIVSEAGIGPSRASADEGVPVVHSQPGTMAKGTANGERFSNPIEASDVEPFGEVGGVAGALTLPGDRVYGNEIDPVTTVYLPNRSAPPPACAGPLSQQMADDLELASGPCDLTAYSIAVAGRDECGSQTYDVHIELWNGDPCNAASSVIEGTQQNITGIPNDSLVKLLSVTLDTPIAVPGTVWIAATFSTDDSGWVVAEEAEVGTTGDFWSENDDEYGCGQYVFSGSQWGGFWANIHCNLPQPPMGACCDGTACTQTIEADCTVGIWQGAFTTCEPNVCLTGACCRGTDFMGCANTTEAGCTDGLFQPGVACDIDTCGPTFKVFENDFLTGAFAGIATDQKYADDLNFGPGTPCDLIAYELVAFGARPRPDDPPAFDARLELWTNDDRGTPLDVSDDLPLEIIPGTGRDFTGILADRFAHELLAGPFEGVQLTDMVWIVMTTSSPNAGPGLGGMADIGNSADAFAIFNSPSAPEEWYPQFWFDGFDPTGCPTGPLCNPAGSFRVRVWCAGEPPTGACCDRMSGTCTEGVRPTDCTGRWVEDGVCDDPGTFFPPCGTHACCYRFPPNPDFIICADRTEEECTEVSGRFVRGSLCIEDEVDCPAANCFDHTDDCYSPHATVGCEDPFCTELVCEQDPFCCGCTAGYCNEWPEDVCCCVEEDPSGTWDQDCADLATALCVFPNDVCEDAHSIVSEGAAAPLTIEFDNTDAAQDGPAHAGCLAADEDQIDHDLWYCWESPCTDTVYISTCGQTQVDTRIAVYEGCQCPPTEESLLDCADDLYCPWQSMAIFEAVVGRQYMIRLGTYPGEPGGSGTFTISCGPPDNPVCPNAAVDCCAGETGSGLAACDDERCCEAVCACDSYCCDTNWDSDCSTDGYEGSGCGAAMLCGELCDSCPIGAVEWLDPPDGVVDARRPHDHSSAIPLEGIDTIVALGPPGADPECWTVCETGATGGDNVIADVVEVAGHYTITLERPITPGELTAVTYTDSAGTAASVVFRSHPANANGADAADPTDVSDLVTALDTPGLLPWDMFSEDMDRSGVFTPLDILSAVDMLNGAEAYEPWNGTALPEPSRDCPP